MVCLHPISGLARLAFRVKADPWRTEASAGSRVASRHRRFVAVPRRSLSLLKYMLPMRVERFEPLQAARAPLFAYPAGRIVGTPSAVRPATNLAPFSPHEVRTHIASAL